MMVLVSGFNREYAERRLQVVLPNIFRGEYRPFFLHKYKTRGVVLS